MRSTSLNGQGCCKNGKRVMGNGKYWKGNFSKKEICLNSVLIWITFLNWDDGNGSLFKFPIPRSVPVVTQPFRQHFGNMLWNKSLTHSISKKILLYLTLKIFANLFNVFEYLCSSSNRETPFSSHGRVILLEKIVHKRHKSTRLNDTDAQP